MLLDFLSLVYPECCAACHRTLLKNEADICTICLNSLPKIVLEQQGASEMEQKFIGRLPLEQAYAFLQYGKGTITQQLLKKLKYHNRPNIGQLLGEAFGRHLLHNGLGGTFDCLLPIPLHPQKQKLRGYNQSETIAAGMAEVLQIPLYTAMLYRKVHTMTQTKLARFARWDNVAAVFETTPEAQAQLSNKHILLVDDVITTGATVEACGAKLLALPNVRLSTAAIASA